MVTRRARGAVFTPESIGRRLIEAALDGRPAPASVCDPAAGDGRLLGLVGDQLGPAVRCFGADLHEPAPSGLRASWAVADSLTLGAAAWPDAPAGGFDLVVGNPPFRNQLERETALANHERVALTAELGQVAAGYADTAAMFLVRACEMASPTGRIVLIMPLSYLAARDAAASRRRVLELATLEGLWIAPTQVFPDANVRVCALVLDRGGPRRRRVRRWVGERFESLAPIEVDSDELAGRPTWSHLAALALGVPDVGLDETNRLGSLVSVTAGFRDQFYGLAPLVVEHPGGDRPDLAPMITSGLIDPGVVRWGERDAKIGGARWRRPAVPIEALAHDPALQRWVAQRRRPKVVIATQTRVIEAAPDPDGRWIPSTPVLAAHVDGADLWRTLAVLLAPPITAWARTHYAGAALSADAVKLSARQVCDLPLPTGIEPWRHAAERLAEAHSTGVIGRRAILDAGALMTRAYGCGDALHAWWAERLPAS